MPNRPSDPPDWLRLGDASRLLGVSRATIRRWSDAGRLSAITTPGGHRRFSRSALERLVSTGAGRARPPLSALGVTSGLTARYRREVRRLSTELPWLPRFDEEQRSRSRELGGLLAIALVEHLDATTREERERRLEEAMTHGGAYGAVAASARLSLSQTVEGFLRFRAPFLHALAAAARRRGLDAAGTTELLQTAEAAMDRLLVATMAGHADASGVDPAGVA